MDAQEMAALSIVGATAAVLTWRWWRRRSSRSLPCGHCCGGRERPAPLRWRATKNGPVSHRLTPPAP